MCCCGCCHQPLLPGCLPLVHSQQLFLLASVVAGNIVSRAHAICCCRCCYGCKVVISSVKAYRREVLCCLLLRATATTASCCFFFCDIHVLCDKT
jgi:hypothetical protein